MELVNATRKAIDTGAGPADPAVREAVEAVAVLLSLVAPYTAEEMWARLGHQPTVARAPVARRSTRRCSCRRRSPASSRSPGKVRDRLEVPPGIAEDELRELALADPAVAKALDGRGVRTVVVRPPRLVNVVPA